MVKENKTKEALRLLVQSAEMHGWKVDNYGRLTNVTNEGQPIRIRLIKLTVHFEKKIPLTFQEKEKDPNRFTKWVQVKTIGLLKGLIEFQGNKVIFKHKTKNKKR